MAPECFQKMGHYSSQTDIWAFGVLIWETVCRKVPYDGLSVSEICTGVSSGKLQLQLPPDSPPGLLAIFTTCQDRSPDSRGSFAIHLQSFRHLIQSTAIPQ